MKLGWKRLQGLVPYDVGQHIQYQLMQRLQSMPSQTSPTQTLLLLEHTPTYTAGRRMKQIEQEAERIKRVSGASFHKTLRGGQLTFHGPGQLVGYPIFHLKQLQLGVRDYVNALENIIIQVCAQYSIQTHTTQDTGVWVDNERKIAALGVHVSRYVTTHGFALNCNTDLSWFHHIVPCGLPDKQVTSITRELSRQHKSDIVTPSQVIPHVLSAFENVLNIEIPPLSQVDPQLNAYIDEMKTKYLL